MPYIKYAPIKIIRDRNIPSIPRQKITTPVEVVKVLDWLRLETVECFVMIALDAQNQLIAINNVSRGTVSNSLVSPREVFRPAIIVNASSIIVCHNHPSGNDRPSDSDNEVTRTLVASGKILDIPVLDHIILGGKGYYSYNENKTLNYT